MVAKVNRRGKELLDFSGMEYVREAKERCKKRILFMGTREVAERRTRSSLGIGVVEEEEREGWNLSNGR